MSDDEVARIAAIADPAARLRAATEGLSVAQQTMTELARLRRALVQDLHKQGWSYAQIADAAGLSRGRIHQVRHQGPMPEGAFFGRGTVRIATPLKRDEIKARPVVAVEDVTASQRLGELARSLGFEVDYEQIPLGGHIDLNRDGLIVICGPRISSDVAGVLETDPVLKFERLTAGWAVRDTRSGDVYASGQDDEPPTASDVAYLSRLRRPDGNGVVIVFTGIHPQGSLGVVQMLTNELADLHEQAGPGTFSTLLQVDYDPETNEPTETRLITPVYRHEPEA
ncbi:helix-turn-helix domain-containing protein [Kribbella sp. NPDC049584]|uniref:helix-turn-helix domain-containing protein n=1 Tax=Kribbella sp. NPDC049584 TaxID=3154833 RepID=UPI00342F1CB9